MSNSRHPKKTDAGKTKQQLIDELNLLRRELGELQQPTSERDKQSSKDLQSVLEKFDRDGALNSNILEVAADAIISIDKNQRITRFNPSAEQLFGYSAREVVGKSLELLLPSEFRRVHRKHVQNFERAESTARHMNQRQDILGLRKDGVKFPAKASISKFVHGDNTTLTVFLRDVSEFKQIEQAAQKSREALEHVGRVGLLGEISASLAHELNQPLAAILTNAQVLKRQFDSDPPSLEQADEAISDVISDARRAGEVIQRLRSLLRPGKHNPEAIGINEVVTQVERLLNSEIVMRQVSLTMKLTPDLPVLSADRVQLQQILLNVLINALDAMEPLQPEDRHLVIRTSHARPNAVEVSVKDSGVGLEGESYQKLLEPYYTTKKHGMGMGLAISNTMLQAHGGRLWAENNQGPGATFHFTVQVAGADVETPAHRRERARPHKEDQPDEATVFIVDDDVSFRKAMARLIGSAGYGVETFESAEEFLQREYYEGNGCLLADLHMPGETGLDLQTTLNTHDYTLPILFITGAGDTSSGVRAMKHGAVDFLSKPVDEQELLRVIAGAVEADIQARDRYAQQVAAKKKIARLTKREGEIMHLVIKGMRNKQIASALGISEKTVKAHRGRVMHKVEAGSVADLVRISETATDGL